MSGHHPHAPHLVIPSEVEGSQAAVSPHAHSHAVILSTAKDLLFLPVTSNPIS